MGPSRYRIVADGRTTPEGEVRDQSERLGLLGRIRDLGLELVSVEPLAPAA